MDRLTRKELKTDKFAAEVGNTVEFLEEHRREATIVAVIAVVVIVAVVGAYYFTKHQHNERQLALQEALRVYEANITDAGNPLFVTFPTEEERDAAAIEAFEELIAEYGESDEASIATFYLGVIHSNQGKPDEAQKYLRETVDLGKQPYASQAAFSLAHLCASLGKRDEAEELLRGLVEKPTVFVSKEQATIALARVLADRDPAEARRLLEPLRSERSSVSRAALTALGEIPQEQ